MNILERYNAMDYGPAPEARNEADAWLAGRDFGKALFLAGEWRAAAGGKTFDVLEPSSGKQLARVSDAGDADVDAAVAAARKALPKWSAASGYQRAKVLYAIGRGMQRHQRLLAVLESIDNGKPIRESRDIDVPLAIRHFLHHAGWAQALDREFPGHRPAGVVGQIIPWNFPLLMLAWKIAPALAAGCTVVLKPAEFTPLTAILFAEICERAGVPKGVVNILPGGPGAGAAIVNHRRRRQDRLHRLLRSRQDHPQGDRRHRQEAVAGARRQVGLHRLRGCRSRQRRRRPGRRHLVQPGPGLLRRLAAAGAGRHRRSLHRQGQDAHEPAARRQPARQEHRHRPAGRRHPARPRPRPRRRRRQAGRRMLAARFRAAVERLFLPADARHRRCAG